MDRLVLGDVGYGKTEVALRAAFKASPTKATASFTRILGAQDVLTPLQVHLEQELKWCSCGLHPH
jgi:RecG-like helicase